MKKFKVKKAPTNPRFKIKFYDDYHEIKPTKSMNVIELGCFPAKNTPYCMYFALYFSKSSKPPSFSIIQRSLYSKINFNAINHFYTNKNISLSQAEVKSQVIQAIHSSK